MTRNATNIPATITRLSANENCYGCSPAAVEAGINSFAQLSAYPEQSPATLKQKIAQRWGVSMEQVVVSAGSVRIIDGLIQAFTSPHDEVLTFDNTFIAYKQLAASHGRTCIEAPLTDMRCTLTGLLKYVTESTRLIFIANPNNPTGTVITHHELDSFLRNVPGDITVALDEAYAEYVTGDHFPDSRALLKKYPNLVILRSFSKIYGLAALRVGYAVTSAANGHKLFAGQIPFSVTAFAAAAAMAALDDETFVRQSVAGNNLQRTLLYNSLVDMGYRVVPSHANFLYLQFDNAEEKNAVREALYKGGIIVCDLASFGQPRALRITIGQADANLQIVSILQNTHLALAV